MEIRFNVLAEDEKDLEALRVWFITKALKFKYDKTLDNCSFEEFFESVAFVDSMRSFFKRGDK